MGMGMGMGMGVGMGTGMGAGVSAGSGSAFNAVPPELGYREVTLQFTLGPNQSKDFPLVPLPSGDWKRASWDLLMKSLIYVPEFMQTDWAAIDFSTGPDLLGWQTTKPDFEKFVENEITDMIELMRIDRERYLAEILFQHDNAPTYWQGLLGLTRGSKPLVELALQTAKRIGEIPTTYFKWQFDRPRPSSVCPGLMPAFGPPSHPAFPSGHSTQAWLMTFTLSVVAPEYKDQLEWLAERVALNRERAGLHYASDSRAGKFLAQECFNRMYSTKCPTIKTLIDDATLQWKA
jgi:hypothetical protein